jgi:hypothetical protein
MIELKLFSESWSETHRRTPLFYLLSARDIWALQVTCYVYQCLRSFRFRPVLTVAISIHTLALAIHYGRHVSLDVSYNTSQSIQTSAALTLRGYFHEMAVASDSMLVTDAMTHWQYVRCIRFSVRLVLPHDVLSASMNCGSSLLCRKNQANLVLCVEAGGPRNLDTPVITSEDVVKISG